MHIFKSILCWALIIAPLAIVTSCVDEVDKEPTSPAPVQTCFLATDSSADGVVTLAYDTNNRVTNYSTAGFSSTLTYGGDSVIINVVTDTSTVREVFYKTGTNWQKSISTYTAPTNQFPGATLVSVSTSIPTYTSGKVSSITTNSNTVIKVGPIKTNLGNQSETSTITYNSDGNIARISRKTGSVTKTYDFTYGSDEISSANASLYESCLSEALPNAILPTILKYITPFKNSITKLQGPDGSITFSNYKKDGNNNVTSYTMAGAGDLASNTGNVKSTFTCK